MQLIIMVQGLAIMLSLALSCSTDQTSSYIDPCPGWPCYKVGTKWVFLNKNEGASYIYWHADSVVTIDGENFLRILIRGQSPEYVRCSGDSVIWIDYIGKHLRWVVDSTPGKSWIRTLYDTKKERLDTLEKVELVRTKYRLLSGIATGSDAYVYNHYSYVGGKFITQYYTDDYVCREYGLVFNDFITGSTELIFMCTSNLHE
jgi:hypothetical protein